MFPPDQAALIVVSDCAGREAPLFRGCYFVGAGIGHCLIHQILNGGEPRSDAFP